MADQTPVFAPVPGLPEGTRPEDIKPIDAPLMYANNLVVQGTGNDFLITFSRIRPAAIQTSATSNIAIVEPVAILALSPQTSKDLLLALTEQMQIHEAQYGDIVSPFSLQRSAGKKA